MALVSPRTPSGIMELLPQEQIAFERFKEIVRKAYASFGFVPLETPVFEYTDVLLTKEGGETEKQVFFLQSTGDLKNGTAPDMALRYDNTVPFARYVAEHERELAFPFRRYQLQKVYRGERAQRGRYREFYQFDIDVIGKDDLALHYDAEIPAVIHSIFSQLDIAGGYTISMNHRKVLKGLLQAYGIDSEDQQKAVLHEIDRLDKMPADKVLPRLLVPEVGLSEATATALLEFVTAPRSNAEVIAALQNFADAPALLLEGAAELAQVYASAIAMGVPDAVMKLNLSTVRGLDYYTGTVYEARLHAEPGLGAICAGGRYENLAGLYTKSKLPGVGMSIGASRLFLYMLETGWAQKQQTAQADVLLVQVDTTMLTDYFSLAAQLRQAGLRAEVYVDAHKMGKQLKYADRIKVPYALLYGPEEKAKGVAIIKHLYSSEQEEVAVADLQSRLAGLCNAA
jgi:histidyl-tRNA synthetase